MAGHQIVDGSAHSGMVQRNDGDPVVARLDPSQRLSQRIGIEDVHPAGIDGDPLAGEQICGVGNLLAQQAHETVVASRQHEQEAIDRASG